MEDTFDWYAQDKDGNVWYLGEDTKEYEDGKVASTAGLVGGRCGRRLGRRSCCPADPRPGCLPAGVLQGRGRGPGQGAEPRREARSRSEPSKTAETEDTTPLEPDVVEHKFYAKGVGVVLVIAASEEAQAARS